MRMRWLVVIPVTALMAPHAAAAQDTTPVDSLALARQYTAWLYAGEADSLVAHSTPEALESFSTIDRWTSYTEMIGSRAGEEVSVIEESWKLRNGDCQYWRVATFSGMDEPFLLRWVLTPDGRIAGVGLGPETQAPPVDRETCSIAP